MFARLAAIPYIEITRMARRGSNLFKRNDGVRAVRILRDSGIEVGMLEIIAKDGTVFRVHAANAATPDDADAKAYWDAEIAKLKGEKAKER